MFDPMSPEPCSRATHDNEGQATILRFARASRVAHWTLAGPFFLLLATGLLLFVPRAKGISVGSYRLVPLIHVILGIAFIAGLAASLLAPPGRSSLYRDLGRLFRADLNDAKWLRYAGYALLGARIKQPPTAKFNAGQKLNTLASALFTLGLIATGVILTVNFFTKSVFDARFVERLYPYHDLFMLIAIPVIAGHVYLAAINPGTRASFRGMLDGQVDRRWAVSHHSKWVDELEATDTHAADR